jgi:hypothetical protein
MPMKKVPAPASPQAYVSALRGWRRKLVDLLRENVLAGGKLEETIKWGHIVYFSNGPALLIRAEEERVLFGFWRGKHLREIEPRLKPGGKYEMATLELKQGDSITPATVRRLTKQVVGLNHKLGNPQDAAKAK